MAKNLLFRKDYRMGNESRYVRWLLLYFFYC